MIKTLFALIALFIFMQFSAADEHKDLRAVDFYDRISLGTKVTYPDMVSPLMLVRCRETKRSGSDFERNWLGEDVPTKVVINYVIEEVFVGPNEYHDRKVGATIKSQGGYYVLDTTISIALPTPPAEFIGIVRRQEGYLEMLDMHLAGINFPVYAPHCNPKNRNSTLSESDYQKVGQFAKTLKEWVQVGLNQGYKSQAGLDWLEKQSTSSNEFVAKWADWQSKHIDQKASDSKEITCSDDEN